MVINRSLKCPKFEIYLWTEQQAERGEDKRWSGIVKHIQTGKSVHFRGVGTMLTFMERQAGIYSKIYKGKKR